MFNAKNALMVGGIAVLAVVFAAWASAWFRGFLQTGGKALPTPNTQG